MSALDRRSVGRTLATVALLGIVGAVAVTTYATVRIGQRGAVDEAARVGTADAIVVLGAAQYDGRPSAVFKARLDHAIALWRDGRAPVLVTTGGRREGDRWTEAETARDYAVARGMPWVYGGVIRTSGMSMTIVPGEGPCLRCLVRELPSPDHSPTAATAGVLSTVVALIGSIEANEAIKLVVDPVARNRSLLVVDVWDLTLD